MKWIIEFGAVRIGAAIQNVYANVDFDVLSLPGGSLIAVFLWLYASAAGYFLACPCHPLNGNRKGGGSRACAAASCRHP